MKKREMIRFSKFLSLVLRHRPEKIGLKLDSAGWAEMDSLLAKAKQAGVPLTEAIIQQVVADNDKQRFALSPDGRRIRANQGHSIKIDLGLEPLAPPAVLYHGTAQRFWPAIQREGLKRRKRHHVHLSADVPTAVKVGQRHGQPVVLAVQAEQMAAQGHQFYRSANGVWLTESVPPQFLRPLD